MALLSKNSPLVEAQRGVLEKEVNPMTEKFKIKMTQPTIVEGVAKKPGDVVEVSKNNRNLLIGLNKAEDFVEEETPAKKSKPKAKKTESK